MVRTGWLVPLLGFYLAGYGYVSWPEHVGLGYREDPLMSARTIKMPAVMRYVYWNNNFHAAHHLAPTVTWDNLPAFTATLPPHPTTTTGLFHVHLVRDMLAGRVPETPDHDGLPDGVPVFYGPMVRGKETVGAAI
jgi:fatty acid desaturase